MVCQHCGDKQLVNGVFTGIKIIRYVHRSGESEYLCQPCLEYIRDMESPKRGRPLRIACKFNPNLIEVN